jgi:hypothetical protein
MPTTFPLELVPSAIKDRAAPEHSVSRFKAENGQGTTICSGCTGHGISFSLDFTAMTEVEQAKLLKFWMEIGGSSAGSCRSFLLPDCWRGWDLIKAWPIWRELMLVDPLDRHWWIVTNRLVYNGDLCFFQAGTLTIENVHRRA